MCNIASQYSIIKLNHKHETYFFNHYYETHMINDEYLATAYFQALRILYRTKEYNGQLYQNGKELKVFSFSTTDRFGLQVDHDILKKMVSVQNVYEMRLNPPSTTNHRILFFPSNINEHEVKCPNIVLVFGYYKTSYNVDMTQMLTEACQNIRDDYYTDEISVENLGGV